MQLLSLIFGSPEYQACWLVREEVLRRPLGRGYSEDEVALEPEYEHIGAFLGEKAVGAVLFKEIAPKRYKLRQMAVSQDTQTKGIGRAIIRFVEEIIQKRGGEWVELSARATAIGFYEKLGYVCVSDFYEETGIPHRKMERKL